MSQKLKCSLLFLLVHCYSFGQWTNGVVDNGFDKKYVQSMSKENNGCFLKLSSTIVDEQKIVTDTKVWFDTVYELKYSPEFPDGKVDTIIMERRENKVEWKTVSHINLCIIGGFHCDDSPKVEIVLSVGGESKKYTFTGSTFSDKLGIEIIEDMLA